MGTGYGTVVLGSDSVMRVYSVDITSSDSRLKVAGYTMVDCESSLKVSSTYVESFDAQQMIQAVVRVVQLYEIESGGSTLSDSEYPIYCDWHEDSSQLLTVREEAYFIT